MILETERSVPEGEWTVRAKEKWNPMKQLIKHTERWNVHKLIRGRMKSEKTIWNMSPKWYWMYTSRCWWRRCSGWRIPCLYLVAECNQFDTSRSSYGCWGTKIKKKVHRFDNIGGRVYCFRSTTLRAGIIVVWKCLNHIVRYSRTEYDKGMGLGGDSRSYESRFHEICSCSENVTVRFRYFEFITFAMSSMLYILLFCFTLYCRFAA